MDNGGNLLTVGGSGNTTVSSVIGGAGGLTKDGAGVLTLSGANTYTGVTTINAGTLALAGANGSIISSGAIAVGTAAGATGALTLDNTSANKADRVPDARTLTLNNGTINFIGNATAASTETLGTITAAKGANLINLSGGAIDQVATLTSTVGAITRTAGATLTIVADGTSQQFKFTGGSAGINKGVFLGASADTANEFAYYPGEGAAVVAPTYGTTTDTLTASKHNKLSGTIATTGAVASIYSINMPSNYGITALTGSLTFSDAADKGAIIKSGGGAAQIGTAGNLFDIVGVAAGELVINTVAAGDNLTLNVGITATTTALTKTGAGTLTLTGNRDYLYTGATTVDAGTLVLNAPNTDGFKSTVIAINNGGTVKLAAAHKVVNTAVFTVNAGGALDMAGFSDTIGALAGSGSVTNSTGTASILTLTAGTQTFSGVVSGTGLGITVGNVAVPTLSGANTYTGPTTLTGGTLSVGATANLGGAASNLVFNGGTLQITGTTLTNFSGIGHPVVYTATKLVGLDINDAGNTFTADQVLNQITGGLTKAGAGTLILNQANTYTGLTTVSAGKLAYGANNVIATGGVTVNGDTAILDLVGYSDSVGAVTLTAGSIIGSGTLTSTSGFTMNNAVATSVSANLAGAVALTKTAADTLTLSGANTYNGPTLVSAGTLVLGGAGALTGTSSITVNGPTAVFMQNSSVPNSRTFTLIRGTLGGTGTISTPITSGANVIIAPGDHTLGVPEKGVLTIANAVNLTGGTTEMRLFSTTANDSDLLMQTTTGGLTYGGILKVTDVNSLAFAVGNQWDLFDFESQSGTFSNDSEFGTAGGSNLPPLAAGQAWSFDYTSGVLSVGWGVIPGDTNSDGVVDAADFITLKKNFGKSTGSGATAGDFNASGTVNWADLGILMNNFGAPGGAPGTTPEPATLGLLAIGALAVLRRRRK